MSLNCLDEFEQRLNIVGERISAQAPRQAVMMSRMQFMLYKKLNELLNQHLAPHGINDTIWTALMMLYSSPENFIYPSDLSHVIVSSRTNVTRLADEMVERGWISRHGCETDRRKIILTLTPAGLQLIEKIIPSQWRWYETIWQDFNAEEKNIFEQLQRRLMGTVSDLHAQGMPDRIVQNPISHFSEQV